MERLKLNEIKFSEMNDKRKRALYEAMWKNNRMNDIEIVNTIWHGTVSKNSYSFFVHENFNTEKEKDKKLKYVEDKFESLFELSNKELFRHKLNEACSGSGDEIKKITTLHSSSLCALLFFYNVTENNPLIINLNGKEVIFSQSIFEFKNTVIERRKPSNIDVVLVGKYKNDNERQVILFLESKFAEYYLDVGCKLEISSAYLDNDNDIAKKIYNADVLRELGMNSNFEKYINKKKESVFCLNSDETCYLAGIKQMISHHIGIENLLAGKYHNENENENENLKEIKHLLNAKTEMYLGTILFDKVIGEIKYTNGESCLQNYENIYGKLNSFFKAANNSRIITLEKPLYYSLFIDKSSKFKLDEKVKQFYFGNILK